MNRAGPTSVPMLRLRRAARRPIELLRLKPFDTATPEGRAGERHRRVALSFGGAIASKLVSAAAALITVPLTLSYLGIEHQLVDRADGIC